MNAFVYIFGHLGNGYTQYPNDHTTYFFQNLNKRSELAETQIIVHRDGDLMYYCYLRKLLQKQYIGFCVLLNGVMITDIAKLFSCFENVITGLVVNGDILQFEDNGNIVSKIDQLYMRQQSVNQTVSFLKSEFDKLSGLQSKLPGLNYSISKEETKSFNISDNIEDILQATHTYGYVYIFKNKAYNTASLNGYKGIIVRLNKEKQELIEKNSELSNKYAKVLQQKKQVQHVVWLFLVIIACAIGLFSLNDHLDAARKDLANANNSISTKNNQIVSNDSLIANQNRQIENLKSHVAYQAQNIQKLQSSLKEETMKWEDSISGKNRQIVKLQNEIQKLQGSVSGLQNSSRNENSRQSDQEKNEDINAYRPPIIIKNLDVANSDINGNLIKGYGDHIFSINSMCLKLKITYEGLRPAGKIALYVKLYTPSGLNTNRNSPSGYSYSAIMQVDKSVYNVYEFVGWGSSQKGYWKKGDYRFEIWYQDKCLAGKNFTIY